MVELTILILKPLRFLGKRTDKQVHTGEIESSEDGDRDNHRGRVTAKGVTYMFPEIYGFFQRILGYLRHIFASASANYRISDEAPCPRRFCPAV
jgi:hypothetical protein